jgi:hypothetical protein
MADDEIAKLRAAAAAAQAALEAAEREAVEKAAAAEKAAEQREEKPPAAGPLDPAGVDAIAAAYAFEGEALEIGALVNGSAMKDAQIRIPLAMLNRHGLIAGATGTGKTRTLQGLAEQLAEKGVPVFAADMKGDLSGVAVPGETSEKLTARTRQIGQDWQPRAQRTEFFVLGEGGGIPLRATVSGFGPLLLAKVLGLNQTQESSLRLVFHYADENGLALVDLDDLRAVLAFLTSDAGKPELKGIGGISTATAGVILRELSAFAADGADDFFGEPEFDVTDLIRLADDGRGILNLLELPNVQSKPALFSTFLMYLLAELFPRSATSTSPSSCSSSTRRTCCSPTRRRTSSTRSRRPCGSSGRRAWASSSSPRHRRTSRATSWRSSGPAFSTHCAPSPRTTRRRSRRP